MFCEKCISYEEGLIGETGCIVFDKCKKGVADLSKVKIEECIEKKEINKS